MPSYTKYQIYTQYAHIDLGKKNLLLTFGFYSITASDWVTRESLKVKSRCIGVGVRLTVNTSSLFFLIYYCFILCLGWVKPKYTLLKYNFSLV